MNDEKKFNESSTFTGRLKDFLYDSGDYILMLGVVVIVGLVINWRIGGLFADAQATKLESTEITEKAEEKNKKTDKKDIEKEVKLTDKKDQKSKKTGKVLKITIPKGAMSQDIETILKENNLIKDTDKFSEYIYKKDVATKLKYGKYEIPEGSSLDEIIAIITK